MSKRRAFTSTLCLAALLILSVQTASAAQAAPNPLVVMISKGQTSLNSDGTVQVALRVRCQAPLQAFELDVSVLQGTTFGSVVIVEAGVVSCDGRWHRVSVQVPAQVGGTAFMSGTVTISVFLGAFDPVAGIDLEARDSISTSL
jgi:hypothetical protein